MDQLCHGCLLLRQGIAQARLAWKKKNAVPETRRDEKRARPTGRGDGGPGPGRGRGGPHSRGEACLLHVCMGAMQLSFNAMKLYCWSEVLLKRVWEPGRDRCKHVYMSLVPCNGPLCTMRPCHTCLWPEQMPMGSFLHQHSMCCSRGTHLQVGQRCSGHLISCWVLKRLRAGGSSNSTGGLTSANAKQSTLNL